MGLVLPLLAFGIGLLSFGLYYQFIDRILIQNLTAFILPHIYYQGSQLVWDILPWAAILTGVVMIISAGILRSRGGSE